MDGESAFRLGGRRDPGRRSASTANAVCFHCQQYVEKLLKAYLTMHGQSAPRTHDLRLLVQLAEAGLPALSSLRDAAGELAVHGVQSRYPDEGGFVSRKEMRCMVEIVERFAAVLLPVLPKVGGSDAEQ